MKQWENNKNVRFRAVITRVSSGTDLPSCTHSSDQIITFYSDRNFKERMEFKNPLVKEYYKTKDFNQKRIHLGKLS